MSGFPAAALHVLIGKARDRGIPGMLAWVISAIIGIGMAVSSTRTLGYPQLPIVVIAFFGYVCFFQAGLRLGFTIAYGLTSFAYRYFLKHHYDGKHTTYTEYSSFSGYSESGDHGSYSSSTGYSESGNHGSDYSGTGYKEDSYTSGYKSDSSSSGQSYNGGGRARAAYSDGSVEWAKAMFGISGTFTEEELKKIRNQKVKENHPDEGGDAEKCKDINRAYDILRKCL